jgi:DNA repair protein RadC
LTLLLDARSNLVKVLTVAEGAMSACSVDPRILFAGALVGGAHSLLCCHNHPSGDAEPSLEDVTLTERLLKCGDLLGLPILDHVIVAGANSYCSLRERHPDLWQRGEVNP